MDVQLIILQHSTLDGAHSIIPAVKLHTWREIERQRIEDCLRVRRPTLYSDSSDESSSDFGDDSD